MLASSKHLDLMQLMDLVGALPITQILMRHTYKVNEKTQ